MNEVKRCSELKEVLNAKEEEMDSTISSSPSKLINGTFLYKNDARSFHLPIETCLSAINERFFLEAFSPKLGPIFCYEESGEMRPLRLDQSLRANNLRGDVVLVKMDPINIKIRGKFFEEEGDQVDEIPFTVADHITMNLYSELCAMFPNLENQTITFLRLFEGLLEPFNPEDLQENDVLFCCEENYSPCLEDKQELPKAEPQPQRKQVGKGKKSRSRTGNRKNHSKR